MALFGEKYGDWVRMVDVDGVSRELCGGTHVASTAEVGLFHVTQETSSASNVRRIEAVTAAGGIEEFRRRTEEMRELAEMLRVPERDVVDAVRKMQESAKEAKKGRKRAGPDPEQAEALAGRAHEIAGVRVITEIADADDPRDLLALSDQLRQKLGDSAVVLGAATDGRVHLVANFAPSVVERGLNAGGDPTETVVTPLESVSQPDTKRGLDTLARLVRERQIEQVVVGLPLTMRGEEGDQARWTRRFAERLADRVEVPVAMHDERLTTRQAERSGGTAEADSRAAAHLLEAFLMARAE
jgi:putative transcription antitermination factor YqgF